MTDRRRSDKVALLVGLSVLGALSGWLLPVVARWVIALDLVMPMKGPLRLIGLLDQPWGLLVGFLVGLVAALGKLDQRA